MRAFIFLFTASLLLISCKKKTEDFTSPEMSEYLPLQTGKFITYRLDSLVFKNFGSVAETHSYQEKHVVDAIVPDGLGRPSYRIYRFTRDTAGTQPWVSSGTYYITPAKTTTEVIENNMRFVKLVYPIAEGHTWKGNEYLGDNPFKSLYSFENDDDIEDWDYTYGNTDETIALNGQTIQHVMTVNGIDRSFNAPVTNTTGYGSLDFMQDKYAKGIGLVYQEFTMWDYQPPNGVNSSGFKTGFGVKRSMIAHN
ncbi:MAG TPA: hypothetical protein VNR87_17860 [Flavisolibacter sp.]|nr:hypothetical protein [Flavisolibacter sp.]